MFSLLEIKNLIVLLLIALAFVAAYFVVKGGTVAWLTGKPCMYGNNKLKNGDSYYDKYYEITVKYVEGEIVY